MQVCLWAMLSCLSFGLLSPPGVVLLPGFYHDRQTLGQSSSQALQAGQLRTTSPQLLSALLTSPGMFIFSLLSVPSTEGP